MPNLSRVIAVVNQKGGVGKTTTAVNLAASIAASERKTLLIDFDPQANATSAFGIEPSKISSDYLSDNPSDNASGNASDNASRQIYDALIGECVVKDLAVRTELDYLHVIPSGRDLYGAEIELVSVPKRERCLERALVDVRDAYEYVVIDCPPSLGLLTLNALTAADAIVIPLQCEYYALEGLAGLLETVALVRQNLNPQLELEGILLTMVDARNNLSRQVEQEVREHFDDSVFRTVIPRNVRLSEAPSHGKPVLLYDIQSKGAVSYLRLADEILRRRERVIAPPPLDGR